MVQSTTIRIASCTCSLRRWLSEDQVSRCVLVRSDGAPLVLGSLKSSLQCVFVLPFGIVISTILVRRSQLLCRRRHRAFVCRRLLRSIGLLFLVVGGGALGGVRFSAFLLQIYRRLWWFKGWWFFPLFLRFPGPVLSLFCSDLNSFKTVGGDEVVV